MISLTDTLAGDTWAPKTLLGCYCFQEIDSLYLFYFQNLEQAQRGGKYKTKQAILSFSKLIFNDTIPENFLILW